MRVTKFGHCCLLVEEGELRVLIDPGVYNEHPSVTGVDVLLITHEHPDHCHIESVKKMIVENPGIEVVTHQAVADLLSKEGISVTVITDGENIERKGVQIGSRGYLHTQVHPDVAVCANTGYFIANKLFFPGDCFHKPTEKVTILALPVAGPWMKLSEAIEYAKTVAPQVAFPVHDGMLKDAALGSSRDFPKKILEPLGIEFRDMRVGSVSEF